MNVFIYIKVSEKIPLGEIVHLFNSAGGKWLVFSVIDYRLYHLPLEMQAHSVVGMPQH